MKEIISVGGGVNNKCEEDYEREGDYKHERG